MSQSEGLRITIPTIGTVLTLSSPWVFMLYHERRNADLIKKMGLKFCHSGYRSPLLGSEITFPAGTKLKVDRIYIRGQSREFDSVTFRLRKGEHACDKQVYGRFWAKLGDVNRIHCEWDEDTVKRETKVSPLSQLAAEATEQ